MKETNKWINALAYIVFFIPLLVDGENEEYKFHTNQGLSLLILTVLVSIVGSFVPVIGWFLILPIGGLFCFVLFIMGVINAINEKMKELPIIGKYRLIK
ncbi:hypothetical protein SANA_14000 [Gottschalkiaceae bacterium SANA]|jgi:uncharacterized membrane protein|nr:hypothetical protein SANA_14000 [Gottschalkiaceae bacterium SANA]